MADISKVVLPNNSEYNIKDTTARSGLTNKVDKVTGKGLSTNDYTTTEKNKLAGIAAGAEVNVQSDWNVTDTSSDAFIKNKPTIPTVPGAATATPKMDGTAAVGSSTKYAKEDHVHPSDTNKVDKVSGKGLSTNDYTTTEKNKLSGIAAGAEVNVQSDWNVTDTSSDAFIKNKPTIPTVPGAATATPIMDGTAAVGSSTKYAKEDHVHPSDTNKVDKVSGKGLSTNDYTTTEKNKLSGIAAGAEVNVQSDWNVTDTSSDAFIKNKPTIPTVPGAATATPIMDGTAAVGSSTKYAKEDHVHPSDTNKVDKVSGKGLSTNDYTTTEKNKLSGIAAGAEVNVQSDWNVTDTSSDAFIKNKPTIPTKTSDLTNNSNFVSDASYVHTDNNYTTIEKNKLSGIATGAEANVQSDWNVTDTSSDAFIKNKPTIPTDTWKSFYGTCTTAAATKDKVVTVSSDQNFSLRVGTIVGVKFSYTNTYSNATDSPITLNVNSTGAKNIWYNTTHSGGGNTGAATQIYGTANRYTWYMYDGTYWVWIHYGVISNSNTVPSAQCETAAGTAAKAATCTYFALRANCYLHFNIRYANTSATALTMNVNSTGAKAIYINGTASSTSNYTLPAGSYIAFYNGTYWDFRTDGKLPASITGDAATVNGHTVATDVPADAKFTDTVVTKTSELTNDSNFVVDSGYVHTDNNYTTTDKNKLSGIAEGAEVNVQSDWNVTDSSSDAFIKNKPSNLVSDASYVHTDNNYTTTEKDKLDGIAEGAEANVQADWSVTDTTSDAFIKNKPTIPSDFPPKSHASTATTYGQGNASNYGHVKLSDTISSSISGGNAAGGIAASQNALATVYRYITDGSSQAGSAKKLETTNTNGVFTDDYGNFIHKSKDTTDCWTVFAYDETFKAIQVYFETGQIKAGGRTVVWPAGDASIQFVATGFITSSQKRLVVSVPVLTTRSSANIKSFSCVARHNAGGYIYMCYGSSNNQYLQLGSSKQKIVDNFVGVHQNGCNNYAASVKETSVQLTLDFANTLRTNAGTNVVTNNTPVVIDATVVLNFY